MTRAALKVILSLAALMLIGPAAWWLLGAMRTAAGAHSATPLFNSNLPMGLLRTAFALALAAGAGLAAARLLNIRWALLCAGIVTAWAAAACGTIDAVIREQPSNATLMLLAAEALLVGAGAVAIAWLVEHADAHRASAVDPARPDRFARPQSPLVSCLIGAAFGLACGALAAWLITQNLLKGQSIAAAAIAALAAGFFRPMVSASSPAWSIVVGIVLAGVAGPIVAMTQSTGPVDLLLSVNAGRIFPLARVMPLDWAAGALLGLPIGLSWSGSMSVRHPAEPQHA